MSYLKHARISRRLISNHQTKSIFVCSPRLLSYTDSQHLSQDKLHSYGSNSIYHQHKEFSTQTNQINYNYTHNQKSSLSTLSIIPTLPIKQKHKKTTTNNYNQNPSNLSNIALSSLTMNISRRNNSTSTPNDNDKPNGFWDKLIVKYGPDKINAPDGFNRWNVVPLAVSTHLCLGACYAWSIFNEPLTREFGVLAQSSNDWTLSNVVITFSGIIVAQGLAMAICGKWVERVGARIAGVTGGLLYGGGMAVGALGVYTHTLPMMYTGYGLIAGAGMGLCYLPPISTLIRWFPDKRGLATGMAICGFGGGAIFITTIKKNLLKFYFNKPDYIGNINDLNISTKVSDDGKLLALTNKFIEYKEVINVTTNELSNIGMSNLQEGLYLVGTGNTGVAATMGTLGLGYLTICSLCASLVKTPKPGWKPQNMIELENLKSKDEEIKEKENTNTKQVTEFVDIDDVMKTPQFWLLWTTFLSTATVGMGLMSCAKDVLSACFASGAFAATYVQALSAANLGGRFIWASASDKLSRKATFGIFGCVGAPLYFSLPWIVSYALDYPMSYGPLIAFYGSTMLIISFFGGGYSTIPAYESDLFGTKYIGAIHGRMMTASALSGILGPLVFSKFHGLESNKSIKNLTNISDDNLFFEKFGMTKENIETLIESKAVNISKLLEICPNGTIDPTPFLYDPAFKTMGICMGIGALANFAVRPVNKKWIKTE